MPQHELRLIIAARMKNGKGDLEEEEGKGKGIKKRNRLGYVHVTQDGCKLQTCTNNIRN